MSIVNKVFGRLGNDKAWAAILFMLGLAVLASCASTKATDLESNIGLYEITSSKCDVAQNQFNPCGSTLFFELLKGQFAGVKNDQLAYVFWSGDPKVDPELQYTSHLVVDQSLTQVSNGKYLLNSDGDSHEYLVFSSGKLTEYHLIYKSSDKAGHRLIQYTLKPVQRGNLPLVRMNYPEGK
jgi:hypothetical protein